MLKKVIVINKIKGILNGQLYISDRKSVKKHDLNNVGSPIPERADSLDFNLNINPHDISKNVEVQHYIQIDFPDGEGSEEIKEKFEQAVDALIDQLEQGRKGVVNCEAGISRSSAVTSTAIAVLEDITFDQALQEIEDARPIVNPYDSFRKYGKSYIEKNMKTGENE